MRQRLAATAAGNAWCNPVVLLLPLTSNAISAPFGWSNLVVLLLPLTSIAISAPSGWTVLALHVRYHQPPASQHADITHHHAAMPHPLRSHSTTMDGWSYTTLLTIPHPPHHAGVPGSLMAFPPDPGNVVSSAPWPAPMAGSWPGSVTGQVADCGFGLVQCSGAEGKVCLLQRGANFYCRWVWAIGRPSMPGDAQCAGLAARLLCALAAETGLLNTAPGCYMACFWFALV